ncbi:hypothetical protein [Paenibacillus sp. GCM10012303]|uniref:hypothetical protein n=1 Tax=Paenibacillus sp. GCM10012303 TaxID=3317340 RepID=UPI003605C9C4
MFVVLIASIVGSSVYAQNPDNSVKVNFSDGKAIHNYLNEISRNVTLDTRNIATIDKNAAKKAGVSNEAILVAEKYFNAQNQIIIRTLSGESILDIEISEEFKNYFLSLATDRTNNQSESLDYSPRGGILTCRPGNNEDPDDCPAREVMIASTDLTSAQNFATNSGYHRTAAYAGGGEAENPARDFTKCVEFKDCLNCVFRNQMVIATNTDDTYRVIRQENEPNPEIHAYFWPHPGWALYVAWWHQYYC